MKILRKSKNYIFLYILLINGFIANAQSFQGVYVGGGANYLLHLNTINRNRGIQYRYLPQNGNAFQLGTKLEYKKQKINIGLFYAGYQFQQKLNNILFSNDIKNKTTTTIEQTTRLKHLGIDAAYEKYIKKNTSFSIAAQVYRVLPSVVDKKVTGAGASEPALENPLYQYSKFDFSISANFNQYIRLSKILKLCISPQFRIEPHKQYFFSNTISTIQTVPQISLSLIFQKESEK